jgi:hypothetical protein
MGQVPAAGEVEAHEGVAGAHGGHEHGLVRLRARIRLHIGEGAIEEPAGPLDREPFGDIDEVAAAVIAPARIALRILVRHHRALGFEHGAGDDVFGRDQLDLVPLPPELALDRGEDLGIDIGEAGGKERVRQPVTAGRGGAHMRSLSELGSRDLGLRGDLPS